MEKKLRRKVVGIVLALLVVSLTLTPQAQSYFRLPYEQRLTVGDELKVNLLWPPAVLKNLIIQVDGEGHGIFDSHGAKANSVYPLAKGNAVAAQPGRANIRLKLFGLVTVRKMSVEVLPEIKLVPGGHSIGVLLKTQGVMVVGLSMVEDKDGSRREPAKQAGLQVGDVIITLNGKNVSSDEQLAEIINNAGEKNKAVVVKFKRGNQLKNTKVKPFFCKETKRYRIGLFVRDSAAGVGTMSFYDPVTRKFGALGHIINDSDTNRPIDVRNGKIVRASVQGIQEGRKGRPGEKIGMFIEDRNFQGEIQKNCRYGIFGVAQKEIVNPYFNRPLPIALTSQVEVGPAEILTVVNGEKIEKYQIEIIRLLPNNLGGKGMVLHITDKRLIAKTGGIIQGMSGSPIIQKGKIIGAVTHVFINDPTRGYGVFIEWMLEEAGITKNNKMEKVGTIDPYFFVS